MDFTDQLAKGFRDAYNGGNWTAVDLKKQLQDIDLEMALKSIGTHNTIATLLFHLHYYVKGTTKYLQGGPMEIEDEYSFTHPEFNSNDEWEAYKKEVLAEGEVFAQLLENLEESKLYEQYLENPKRGDYYRNLQGITEHVYYHLGQIVLLKRLLAS